MEEHTDAIAHDTHDDHGNAGLIKKIWRAFWILLIITVIDFILYFTMPPSMFRNYLFIVAAIFKAFYIVGIFMHMKFEQKWLMYIIILPMVFVIGLIMALLYEGDFWSSI